MHDTSDTSPRAVTAACLALSVAALFIAACEQQGSKGAGVDKAERSAGEKSAAPSSTGDGTANGMPGAPDPSSGNVQCLGIHECKGKSACHVAGGHACAGLNECKGKGWISVPAAECQAKGGTIVDS